MTTTDTGPDWYIRTVVRNRAEDCCELCGLWAVAGHIHHRRPRQMGGTGDPAANLPSNLVLFCGMCHHYVETIERASAYRYGWLVPQGMVPAQCAFLLWGRWVYLTDSGTYRSADPADDHERDVF